MPKEQIIIDVSNPECDPAKASECVNPDTIELDFTGGVEMAANQNPGCTFFILGPVMWILNRRNKLSQEKDIDFQP